MDNGDRIDAIIIEFLKPFDSVLHDRLLTKTEASGVDSRVVEQIKEFLPRHMQRVRVGGQLSEEVRVRSGVPQGCVLGPLLFFSYVSDTWRNIGSSIRLFSDDYNM
jgi:hypothetical protein